MTAFSLLRQLHAVNTRIFSIANNNYLHVSKLNLKTVLFTIQVFLNGWALLKSLKFSSLSHWQFLTKVRYKVVKVWIYATGYTIFNNNCIAYLPVSLLVKDFENLNILPSYSLWWLIFQTQCICRHSSTLQITDLDKFLYADKRIYVWH